MSLKLLTQEYVDEAERLDRERRAEKSLRPVEGFPFWPHEVVRGIVVTCFFAAALLYLAAYMPYFLEEPANPAGQPDVILPDWYLLFSYGFLKWGNRLTILNGPDGAWIEQPWHFWDQTWWKPAWEGIGPWLSGQAGLVPWDLGMHTGVVQVPIIGAMNAKMMGLIGLHTPFIIFLFALPFLDRGKAQRPQEQPFMTAFGVYVLAQMFTASVYSINTIVYNRWPIFAKGILQEQLAPYFQFLQWDLLSWLTALVPLALGVGTYVAIKAWRERMMDSGDRVFKLNRNYHRVR